MTRRSPALALADPAIPAFFLYGEAPKAVGERFLHLEPLDDRSRPSNWNIRPHAHAALHHIFFLTAGRSEMSADGQTSRFAAPVLLLIPAGIVHAFLWQEDSEGQVLTLSDAYLKELMRREPAFAPLFATAGVLAISETAPLNDLAQGFDRLARELAWTAPAHASAVEAHLLTILVEAARLAHHQAVASRPGPQAELVARFRLAVEQHLRADRPLLSYAAELGVSLPRLRTACAKVAGRAPLGLIQDRLLVEAKRLLLYSNMTVAEVAFRLGFDDPAYFSRFFTNHAGVSPRGFRVGHKDGRSAP